MRIERRKYFTPSEAVYFASLIKAREKEKALERKREGNRLGGLGGKEVAGQMTGNLDKGESRDKIAASVGMSEAKLRRATPDKQKPRVNGLNHGAS